MEKRELERKFRMTSYARNSSVQKKSSDNAKHITLETVQQLYKETRPKSLGIADLGCSSGPNTLSTIRDIIKTVEIAHHREIPKQPLPEFSIFLNDLPQHDFNSIFKTLPDFHMELKRDTKNDVPPALFDHQGKSINKGCINICSSSPEAVSKAYYSQFKEDFSMFLRSRSKEVVAAGRMVLIILGREGPDHVDRGMSFTWEILARAIADLVGQGETEEEKLDSYETHFYAASAAEIEGEVNKEGSFELEKLEIMEVEKKDNEDGMSSGELAAKTIRAVQESMLAPHFGEEILDKLFDTYGRMFDEELAKEDIRPITFKKAYDQAKDIILKTLQQLYKETRPKSLGIADLGCSSGPNTLSTIRDIIKAVIVAHHREIPNEPLPEFSVSLNDLPRNDFNSIFKSLPDFHIELKRDTKNDHSPSVFIAAFPGSFYGRLFPENTIHFIYASFSLHWLSKIPPALYDDQGKSINKGCINICSSSPEAVSKAYYSQFKEDFSMFLRSRSKEVVAAGRMVLIILGREGPEHVGRGNSFLWELLARAIADLVSQGEIEEEKLDSYELHFYAPSAAEIEGEVNKEGSFELEKLEMLEVDMEWGNEDGISYGKAVAKTIRAVQESMLASHFGEEILNKLFDTYGRIIDEEIAKEDIKHITFVVVLRRKL
ncbi:hypothetical protein IGI04_031684 [Brassica rapa subsp. trilocularis]|uniref:Uncharacterized protein n=1 Tax=Brassica rapa subsp. trilocularis TaxID=1813537 RepID=A0ABQ7LUA0_BRACM|nr:hypothetical protein IGI04_031684 [Brassica rapa subsp. trilocularis]